MLYCFLLLTISDNNLLKYTNIFPTRTPVEWSTMYKVNGAKRKNRSRFGLSLGTYMAIFMSLLFYSFGCLDN